MSKKGNSTTTIALILIIALLIVVFVLLPAWANEKEDLGQGRPIKLIFEDNSGYVYNKQSDDYFLMVLDIKEELESKIVASLSTTQICENIDYSTMDCKDFRCEFTVPSSFNDIRDRYIPVYFVTKECELIER